MISSKNIKRLTASILILTMFMMTGCGNKSVCPHYPTPPKIVRDKIQSLDNKDVDLWMLDQAKLKKKIEVCNEN